ncbi:MAG: aminoglycoside phosphotransferase family protein [Oscillospiraceae bacterium]|nr:aminoglycoside phosphotransferase family protein [Oscillospiraceae bacterium]
MGSRTKVTITAEKVKELFSAAGFNVTGEPIPVTEGEFNAIFSVPTDRGETIIKLSPDNEDNLLTYEKGIMKREIDFYSLISDKTDIPVPRVLYSDLSKSAVSYEWFIMDKISGKTLDKTDFSNTQKQKIILDILAKHHKLRGDGYGYNGEYDNWYDAIRAMITNLYRDGENKLNSLKYGKAFLKKELSLGARLINAVDKNKELLKSIDCTLVNFDLWDKNMIFDGEKVYIIDPERAFFGDFISDIVITDIMKTSLSQKKGIIEEYKKAGGKDIEINRDTEIRFNIMLGYISFLMVVEKYYRYSFPDPYFIRNAYMIKPLKKAVKALENK